MKSPRAPCKKHGALGLMPLYQQWPQQQESRMMAMMINQRVLLSNRLQKQLFIIVPPKNRLRSFRVAPLLSYYDERGKMCKNFVEMWEKANKNCCRTRKTKIFLY